MIFYSLSPWSSSKKLSDGGRAFFTFAAPKAPRKATHNFAMVFLGNVGIDEDLTEDMVEARMNYLGWKRMTEDEHTSFLERE